jgi:hypothetical protein
VSGHRPYDDFLDDDGLEWVRLMSLDDPPKWVRRPLICGASFALSRQVYWSSIGSGSRYDDSYLWMRLSSVGSELEG